MYKQHNSTYLGLLFTVKHYCFRSFRTIKAFRFLNENLTVILLFLFPYYKGLPFQRKALLVVVIIYSDHTGGMEQ